MDVLPDGEQFVGTAAAVWTMQPASAHVPVVRR